MTCRRCAEEVSAHWPGAPTIAVSHVWLWHAGPPVVCSVFPTEAFSRSGWRVRNLERLLDDLET